MKFSIYHEKENGLFAFFYCRRSTKHFIIAIWKSKINQLLRFKFMHIGTTQRFQIFFNNQSETNKFLIRTTSFLFDIDFIKRKLSRTINYFCLQSSDQSEFHYILNGDIKLRTELKFPFRSSRYWLLENSSIHFKMCQTLAIFDQSQNLSIH